MRKILHISKKFSVSSTFGQNILVQKFWDSYFFAQFYIEGQSLLSEWAVE